VSFSCGALALLLSCLAGAAPARAQILNQEVLFDQDPWDSQSRLGVGDCITNADGSITCDTKPKAQVWVETYGVGRD
jgi:hypothetical protein